MSIFNSLGSNYDFGFVLRSLFASGHEDNNAKLKKFLEEKYAGDVVLTYKGRVALRIALRIIDKSKEYVVGVCGFTCFAVYEAIVQEGYKVKYLDIEKNSLNFSFETLVSAYKNNPKLKIIFIQNTLGYPCDIEKISKFCRENNIILVEDLAHSIGTKYNNGHEAGTVGDFVMLSFSQDKVIDRVSGGALIVRNLKYSTKLKNIKLKSVSTNQQLKDRFYPMLVLLIRKMYVTGLGKVFHLLLKKMKFLSNPMSYFDSSSIHSLPASYAGIILTEFLETKKILSHRQKIAGIYARLLDRDVLSKPIADKISSSSNLRFPIFVSNRVDLIKHLKKSGVFVSDVWYDVPIAPKKYLENTDYEKGECPNSEFVSERILNLPTHRNVSEKEAEQIANNINLWLKSQ